ncbi:hypothetical protein SPBR_07398 [Sporothrix brasiliensis 5110]|uniref:Uncharacterized protein n=1 Tax=Sporothrix brasiliensis 5110 TaxID=1398154 RepID=A0A0C2IG37_9PEZI|nr:uncharacterized protein SPBR_07398 [Sporothrix brasiliensis 5110]KIH88136.1 hypothetical protein SPBR_07398 [Sporothrix brasiliensis 5110]
MSDDMQPGEIPQWQRETHNEYFYNLCDLKFALDEDIVEDVAILTRERLSSLSIQVLDDLNVDDESPLDFSPSFYAPVPRDTFETFLETYTPHLFPDQYSDGTSMVLLLSFRHDKAARIIQAHFDGHRLFIRQSRLLDLDADEPTPDAYLLLRWMASRPQGNTAYGKPFCTDDAPMAITTKEPEEPSSTVAVQA